MSDDEISQQLANADWGTIGKELTAYALLRSLRYSHLPIRHSENEIHEDENELTLGQTTQDIVQEVIKRTLSGKRRWNPVEKELLPFLKAIPSPIQEVGTGSNRG